MHVARYPKGQTRFYRHGGAVTGPSQAIARAIAEEAPELSKKSPLFHIPALQPPTNFNPRLCSERKKIVLFVGRVHPEKGVHLLVEAFARGARTIFAEWRLMIVGPSEREAWRRWRNPIWPIWESAPGVKGSGFRGSILDPTELERISRGAGLCLSVAGRARRIFGLAPLEAMSHGCAVFVSDLGCFHDFIRDNETGFIFDHRAERPAASLREKLENAVVDLALLSGVADAGYRKSAEFSLSRVADQFLDDFNSITHESDGERTSR